MAANTTINVTELDFDKIKDGIKAFISAKNEFTDYDFEGSTISHLIDTLAYNTYQNAFYSSMVGNEMFLDSAVLRDSVVSRAKMLNYVPTSATGSFTTANVTITPTGSPDSVTIAKNTQWSSTIDGVQYLWVTPEAYTFNATDSYTGQITITEGRPVTHKFTVSTTNPVKYILPNKDIEKASISVDVQTSSTDTSSTTYTLADDILAVTANSNVYFVQETNDLETEIIFGDGVIGNAPDNGNIITVGYRIVNGTKTNGVGTFTKPSSLGGSTNYTITYNANTAGGQNLESIESIKFNAPKNFEVQNRAVLAEDYRRIILKLNTDIQTIRVWGGQDNVPPVYGKIYISAKPKAGTLLTSTQKNAIVNQLKDYNVLAVEPEFIDAKYLYVSPTIVVNWDSRLTTLSASEVRTKIVTAINSFETTNMGTFENERFRYSRFVDTIDEADTSIKSNLTTIAIKKTFAPSFTASTKYTIDFDSTVNASTLISTWFTFSGKTAKMDDDGIGNVRIYYIDENDEKVYLDNTAGTINYVTGVITLTSFAPTAATDNEITITLTPDKRDVTVEKYQLMLLKDTSIEMFDEKTSTTTTAVTVNTTGSVTQIRDSAVGTLI